MKARNKKLLIVTGVVILCLPLVVATGAVYRCVYYPEHDTQYTEGSFVGERPNVTQLGNTGINTQQHTLNNSSVEYTRADSDKFWKNWNTYLERRAPNKMGVWEKEAPVPIVVDPTAQLTYSLAELEAPVESFSILNNEQPIIPIEEVVNSYPVDHWYYNGGGRTRDVVYYPPPKGHVAVSEPNSLSLLFVGGVALLWLRKSKQ